MFNIILYQPQIAPNTGNIIRLVANNGCQLHLIEPLGFSLEEKKLRRAGLDYHHMAHVKTYANLTTCLETLGTTLTQMKGQGPLCVYAITTKGATNYSHVQFQPSDIMLFGSETAGLPEEVLMQVPESQKLVIPMRPDSRSLNLSNAVAIVSYEGLRQHCFQI